MDELGTGGREWTLTGVAAVVVVGGLVVDIFFGLNNAGLMVVDFLCSVCLMGG